MSSRSEGPNNRPAGPSTSSTPPHATPSPASVETTGRCRHAMRCGCSIRGPALRARLPPDLSTVNRSVRFRLPAGDRHVTRTWRAPGPRSPRRSPLERIASRYRWRSRPSASSTSGNGFNRSMQETSQQTSSWVWSMPERRMTCETALPIPATHGRLQMSQFMACHETQYSETGAQGRSHVELLARTRRLGEVRIVSRSGTSAERLFARLSEAADTLTPEDRSGPPPVLRAVRGCGRGAGRRKPDRDGDQQHAPGVRRSRPGARRACERRGLLPPRHAGAGRRRGAPRPRRGGSARGGLGGSRGSRRPLKAGLIGRDTVDAELGEIVKRNGGRRTGGPRLHGLRVRRERGPGHRHRPGCGRQH